MKPKTIFGIALIAGFTALLLMNFGQQVGGYMDFTQAQQSGSKAHVVGTWVKERAVSYDRERNVFSFYMADEKGQMRLVEYANPKPANFEDAEKVVVEGYVKGDVFHADHILVKCPSKYNDARGIEQATSAAM
ncbi:MAG TPA: cytochrome c maturation protein CcmE [Rhodothermales bacterium]|nr:cytochrome c maturation protein CcmE [Rhodothermales bacterium]